VKVRARAGKACVNFSASARETARLVASVMEPWLMTRIVLTLVQVVKLLLVLLIVRSVLTIYQRQVQLVE
jgi:hypothetical protein